jgi:D-alanyl-D-alanine carboxypeptidase (penicillin-binding protein 5/6)
MLGDMLGGYRAAIMRMTAKAHALGANSTRAMSPSGLDGPGWETITTPRDLGMIFRAALGYPLIAQIMRQPSAQFPGRTGAKTIYNQNELLARYPGDLGGKTGFTNLAGKTYVGAAQRGNRRLVVVLMKGSGDLYGQATSLLDWGFSQPG